LSDLDINLIVPGTLDGLRLDRALSLVSGLSRAEVAKMIDEGQVLLDATTAKKPSVRVSTGQHLVAHVEETSDDVLADETVPVEIVGEDDDFLVVNKRAGQVVHPGAGQRTGTLIAGVLARRPEIVELVRAGLCDPYRPGVVHRLDKGTSGLLVVATTPRGLESLRDQLFRREMGRTYLGLVDGHVEESRGVVEAPIGRSTRQPTLMAVRADGRAARTHYEVLSRYDKPAVTLLRLRLDTGRTHQIRVHLSTIGHPVVNDLRYGHQRDHRLPEERFFLHSQRLEFLNPKSEQPESYLADLPDDLAALTPEWRRTLE
jgi:23S rRNA pseudouridine1911/1915/1917 synthase